MFTNGLNGWTQVAGGENYKGVPVLSVESQLFKKVKLQDRRAEYDDQGEFQKWVYFWRKSGYVYKNLSLKSNHIYYLRVRCDNPTDSVLGYGIMDNANGCTFSVNRTIGMQNYNALYVPERTGAYKFALAYGELPEEHNLAVYTEYALIIDLTETFGIGKEPGLEWCCKNIYYENDWRYKVEIIEFIPNNIEPLVFSRDRDTLIDLQYIKILVTNNFIYVKGEDIDTIVSSANQTGLFRKERYLDLSSSVPRKTDGVMIPEVSYIAMLKNNANATLRKLVVNEIIEGNLYLLSNKQFGRDFI
ncbi:Gp37-like protein [Anaerovorax sp. IOR16]|uniref:Gp37-like protein n=1 Tax=Anaerovorax sp. IOR16 TaxID=2773458 RepID=UPI0019CF4DD3|nr:hypothetical protein [Anaerovorax sp. IOR16]